MSSGFQALGHQFHFFETFTSNGYIEKSTLSMEITETVQVTAPSDLNEGYQFDATIDGKTVRAAEGGIRSLFHQTL